MPIGPLAHRSKCNGHALLLVERNNPKSKVKAQMPVVQSVSTDPVQLWGKFPHGEGARKAQGVSVCVRTSEEMGLHRAADK